MFAVMNLVVVYNIDDVVAVVVVVVVVVVVNIKVLIKITLLPT